MNNDLSIQLEALMKTHGIANVLSQVSVALQETVANLPDALRWEKSQELLQQAKHQAEKIEHLEQVETHGEHLKGSLLDVLYYIWVMTTGNEAPEQFVLGYPSIESAVIDFLVESKTELPKIFQWERPDGVLVPLEVSQALNDYLHHQLQDVMV